MFQFTRRLVRRGLIGPRGYHEQHVTLPNERPGLKFSPHQVTSHPRAQLHTFHRFNASGARHWNHGDYVMISPQARLTERFTRTSPTAIRYEFTVEDAANYSRPWRAETQMVAARGPVYEYGCHEGNYALRNILAGGRENTPAAAAK